MRESGRTKAMLCELLIVALFLALSSVTLLRLFAAADAAARESAALAQADMLAQDVLERLSAGEDVPARAERAMADGVYTVLVDTSAQAAAGGEMRAYSVTVERDGEAVTSLQTACYWPERSEP